MSTFDADSFLNQSVEGALDTKYPVVPADKYVAQVDKVSTSDGIISKGENAGKKWVSLNLHWNVMDEELKREMERDKVVVVQRIFLDLNDDDTIAVGKGKNVKLGQVRDAMGQNDPSQPWSPNFLIGQMAEIDVVVTANDQGDERNDIRGVAEYQG